MRWYKCQQKNWDLKVCVKHRVGVTAGSRLTVGIRETGSHQVDKLRLQHPLHFEQEPSTAAQRRIKRPAKNKAKGRYLSEPGVWKRRFGFKELDFANMHERRVGVTAMCGGQLISWVTGLHQVDTERAALP